MNPRRPGFLALGAIVVLIMNGTCAPVRPPSAETNGPAREEPHQRRKQWSGLSFEAETLVLPTPSFSLAAPGWDQERVWSGSDDWEPAIAADPGAPFVYQLTTRFGRAQPEVVFRRSIDGGATWDPDQSLSSNAGDPMIEVADDGTVFAVMLVGGGFKVMLTRSIDHGVSWTSLLNVLVGGQPGWGDRPVLAISPDGQDVYIAFNNNGSSYVVSSHDGGISFDPAVQTSNDGRSWFHSGGAVAPNGDVYFAAADYGSGFAGETHISVLRSADAGASWTTTRIDTSAEVAACDWAPGCYFGFLGPSVGLAIDPAGFVVIAYNAGDAAGDSQKMYVRSTADGIAWSERLQVSSTVPGVHNGYPALGASRTRAGDFRLVWQTDANGSQIAWNTWLRRTVDGGTIWSPPERLSDLASGAPYKHPAGYSFVYGDYLEMAVDGEDRNHVIWGAGASWNGPGGSWYTRGMAPDCAASVFGLSIAADSMTLAWMAGQAAEAYDVVSGDLGSLAASDGDFSGSLLGCLDGRVVEPQTIDPAVPAVGDATYYLVRARRCGGQAATYDTGAASQIESRDQEIAASSRACP